MNAVIPVGPPYKVLLHFQIVPLYISLCKGAEEAGDSVTFATRACTADLVRVSGLRQS